MSARRASRALVAGGFALCLALAPGTAWAEDDPAPAPPEAVTDVLEGEQGSEPPQDAEVQEAEGEQSGDETPEEPPFAIPPEVITALEEFAAQAGFSEECVNGVTGSLELIVNGIAGLPAELEELGTGLAAAAEQSISDGNPDALTAFLEGAADPAAPPIGGDIEAGLTQLAETLESDACQPEQSGEEPDPTDPPAQPAAGPQPPPQNPPAPAPQAPVQSAVYPGYAPTGAEEVDGPSPAAIAMALAFLAGSLAWSERRWRAARSD